MRSGISTHLYHSRRLELSHLEQVASHGFDELELFATRSHFDYHDPAMVAALGTWLDAAGLTLHAVHAPIVERLVDGEFQGPLSLASDDNHVRARAVRETLRALEIARQIPFRHLVVHLGIPDAFAPPGHRNSARAAARSLEELCAAALPLGVRVAAEVIPNALSSPEALVALLEGDGELPGAGICLDTGHASLMGDLVESIEVVAEFLSTVHLHDNLGHADEHLAPFEGTADWAAVLTALQKVGYEGPWLFEVADVDTPAAVLERTRQARRRFEDLLRA